MPPGSSRHEPGSRSSADVTPSGMIGVCNAMRTMTAMISTTHGGRRGDDADAQPPRETAESGPRRRLGVRIRPRSQRYRIGCERSDATPPPPARPTQTSRGLDVLTAILLGVVSLTTALGAWQASTWSAQADDFGEIARPTPATSSITADRRLAGTTTASTRRRAAGAQVRAPRGRRRSRPVISSPRPTTNVMVNNYLGRIVVRRARPGVRSSGARTASRPTRSPTSDPVLPRRTCAATPTRTRSSRCWRATSRTLCRRRPTSSRRPRSSTRSRCSCSVSPASTGCEPRGSPPSRSAASSYLASLVLMATAY